MNGKVLKVKQYNLEFGGQDRFVNALSCFKYKANGNIYIIYSDVNTSLNIVYYGSGHVKGDSVLCMPVRDREEEEIIKKYIYKLTQKENMDDFESISLNEIVGIEIIGSSKIEVKPEILTTLIDLEMPKQKPKEDTKKTYQKKKGSFKKILILLFIIVLLLIGGYYYLFVILAQDSTEKSITCTKSYQHNELVATVEETNKYNFNIRDELESADTIMVYQFNETNYQDFIMKGTYYKYMPSSDTEGGWDKNDEEYIFKVMTKTRVDTSYSDPTNYEEVLSYYKVKGYTCTEEIVNK